ncbi:MAG: hypothetical protein HF978_20545 [Desulfobacteraceae bacterium]|nr:hypothetical protein [Desulfobacteraceae bacterium]MBC2757938.1 hypothetical protein [Desulfobacteraceae bacterium]
MDFLKTLSVIIFLSFILFINQSIAENTGHLSISKIQYTEKTIHDLSEIQLHETQEKKHKEQFFAKEDELIDLLEAHKKAAKQGQGIDRIQEKVNEISEFLEEQKAGPMKISANDFHNSICFKCHTINDFSPSDKTQKQWRRLIEDDGHAIFENISWETPYQKNQILEFLLENAGTYRAEGIGLWH